MGIKPSLDFIKKKDYAFNLPISRTGFIKEFSTYIGVPDKMDVNYVNNFVFDENRKNKEDAFTDNFLLLKLQGVCVPVIEKDTKDKNNAYIKRITKFLAVPTNGGFRKVNKNMKILVRKELINGINRNIYKIKGHGNKLYIDIKKIPTIYTVYMKSLKNKNKNKK